VKARLVGLASLIVVGLTAGGCTSAASGSSPAPAPTSSAPDASHFITPMERLRAAIPTANSPAFAFSIKHSDYSSTGVIDPRHKLAEIESTEIKARPSRIITMTTLLTAKKAWVKVHIVPSGTSRPAMPASWMLIDQRKIKYKGDGPFLYGDGQYDPGYASLLCSSGTSVTQTGAGTLQGVADLGGTEPGEIFSAAEMKALEVKAYTLPFTAELDSHGRLTKLSIRIPAAGAYPARVHEIDYTGYGTVAVPTIPTAAQQTNAPRDFYTEFPVV